MFFTFYRQDLPQAPLPVLFLLTGRFLGFSDDPTNSARCTDQGKIWHLDRSRGGGLRPQKLEKNWSFTNIIAPKEEERTVGPLLSAKFQGSSVGISFTHGPILGFFAPQGRHVAPIKVKFGRESGP